MHTAPPPQTDGTEHTPPHPAPPDQADAPALRHRRDALLPAVAAALHVDGTTLTCTGAKGDQPPPLHPLVSRFLDELAPAQRTRHTGRCAETVLLSRFLHATEEAREAKRARRSARKPRQTKPLSHGEARKALRRSRLTTRRIREDGDPLHGSYAPPCRSCTALLGHFGIALVAPETDTGTDAPREPAP